MAPDGHAADEWSCSFAANASVGRDMVVQNYMDMATTELSGEVEGAAGMSIVLGAVTTAARSYVEIDTYGS